MQSASELRAALAALFPALPRDVGACGESVFEDAGPTFHSVLREFAHFFARDIEQFSDRQLRRFAELVVRSERAGGDLADAMKNCLLAQAGPLKFDRRFDPFLAAAMQAPPVTQR